MWPGLWEGGPAFPVTADSDCDDFKWGFQPAPPQAEGPHSQHRERSFSPGKREPTWRSQAAKTGRITD